MWATPEDGWINNIYDQVDLLQQKAEELLKEASSVKQERELQDKKRKSMGEQLQKKAIRAKKSAEREGRPSERYRSKVVKDC